MFALQCLWIADAKSCFEISRRGVRLAWDSQDNIHTQRYIVHTYYKRNLLRSYRDVTKSEFELKREEFNINEDSLHSFLVSPPYPTYMVKCDLRINVATEMWQAEKRVHTQRESRTGTMDKFCNQHHRNASKTSFYVRAIIEAGCTQHTHLQNRRSQDGYNESLIHKVKQLMLDHLVRHLHHSIAKLQGIHEER